MTISQPIMSDKDLHFFRLELNILTVNCTLHGWNSTYFEDNLTWRSASRSC